MLLGFIDFLLGRQENLSNEMRAVKYKEKVSELKQLQRVIEEFHTALQMHCRQFRPSKGFTDDMMKERLNLGLYHNKVIDLTKTGFFNRKRLRKKIQNIVGSWITKPKLDRMMNWNENERDRIRRWKEFNREYRKVLKWIETEASRVY